MDFKKDLSPMDREKLPRAIASICTMIFAMIGLLSEFVLHRSLGFWYVLISFSVALFGVGFFSLFKSKNKTKSTWWTVSALAAFLVALVWALFHFELLKI